jgi:hypothetical protein
MRPNEMPLFRAVTQSRNSISILQPLAAACPSRGLDVLSVGIPVPECSDTLEVQALQCLLECISARIDVDDAGRVEGKPFLREGIQTVWAALAISALRNTPRVDLTVAARDGLKNWIRANLSAIDRGNFSLRTTYLANWDLSATPRGLARHGHLHPRLRRSRAAGRWPAA